MARSRRSRRTASRRRNSGGGGGGGGGGCGNCSCCQPCGVCGISLKCAAFIWAIVHIVWGALWVLQWVLWLLNSNFNSDEHHASWIYWAWWGAWILCAVFWLILGIVLMLGVRCSTNPCKVHFYLIGVILECIIVLVLGFIFAWYWGEGGVGYGLSFTLFVCFFWWYPYWCIYAYYYQLTGHSWCNCGCH